MVGNKIVVVLFVIQFTLASSFKLEGRMAGGKDVNISDFPYQVSIEVNKKHYCGGSIIGDDWVLSAAQCVDDIPMESITLRAGSSLRESGGEIYSPYEMIQHPEYDQNNFDYDFVLIRIHGYFSNNTNIKKTRPALRRPLEGTTLYATGWGTNSIGSTSMSKQLQVVEIPVVDQTACRIAYRTDITERMLCAGIKKGNQTTCRGDVGGPLYDPILQVQVGVTSWGIGCYYTKNPAVFANVASVREWIRETAGV